MKRHLAPLLILVLLLLAGGSLWLHSHPVSVAKYESQTESPADTLTVPADSPEDVISLRETAQEDASADGSVPLTKFPDTNAISSDAASAQTVPAPVQAETSSAANTSSKSAVTPAPTPTQSQTSPAKPEQSPASEPEAEDPTSMIQDLLTQMNKERTAISASPLVLDSALSSVAQLRAEECTTQFGHIRPNGTTYRSAVTDAGLSYQHLGENLATGQSSAQAVIQSWDNSDGHHDNIVNEDYTKVGIGLAKNTNGKYGGYSWAVVFSD